MLKNEGPLNRRTQGKRTFRENQMHAKVYIAIPIEKQILSALRNRFPFLDRTSQRQDMEKNISTDHDLQTALLQKKSYKITVKIATIKYVKVKER